MPTTSNIALHSAAHLRQASAHSLMSMSECFSFSCASNTNLFTFLQSASRFESVLLASIKALQASAQTMQSFTEFPFPLYLCFLLNKFRMRLHMLYKHQYSFEFFIFHDDIILCCNWYIVIKVILQV
jgi:hypothetical protein